MIIKEFKTSNFKGINNLTLTPGKFTILAGKNGVGKTSTLEAIRYALTGAEPEGEIVTHGQSQCVVEITIENDKGESHSFKRVISKGSTKVYMDGVVSTQKAVDAAMESYIGIPVANIEITSSGDLVRAMKPREFSSFILKYVPSAVSRREVADLVPDTNPGLRSEIEEIVNTSFPEKDITLDMIEQFYSNCKAARKEFKDNVKLQEGQLAALPQENPGHNVDELRAQLTSLMDLKRAKEEYASKKRAYDAAVVQKANWEKQKNELTEEIAKLPSERRNPITLRTLEETLSKLNASLANQNKTVMGVNAALGQLRVTKEALEKPICPISPLITCHENKTVAIKEIEDSIKSTEEGLVALNEEIEKTEREIADTKTKVVEENAAITAYDKRCTLARSLKILTDNEPKIPAEPALITGEPEDEVRRINVKLSEMEKYETFKTLSVRHAGCLNKVEEYDILCKAFAENGVVRQTIVSKFLGHFSKLANDRSGKFNPKYIFDFVVDDGVKVLMSKDGTTFCSYEELSGGEKAYMLFVLLDIFNQLTGTRLLFLDELNVMDTEVLDTLLAFVKGNEADFDHIFLSCVDFPEITDLFKKHKLA